MLADRETQLGTILADTNEKSISPFPEWVKGYDSSNIEGVYVEAVFAGHTHENHIFCNMTAGKMDSPKGNDIVPEGIQLPFSWHTFYIETTTATKNG